MHEMDWEKYAEHYDEMCYLNPAYQQNIEVMKETLIAYGVNDVKSVCDVGGGTGNYIVALLDLFPGAEYTHLDGNGAMSRIAAKKIGARQMAEVSFVQSHVEEYLFPRDTYDLVICTNALYATVNPLHTLGKIFASIRPGGYLFSIDFGKVQNTADWTMFLFWESLRRGRFLRYLNALVVAREVIRQNQATTAAQKSGRYWTHTAQQFSEHLSRSGFEVLAGGECYRGYCNYALGRK
jgi:ubiquinone/menaquinone biosynthesis C-methylase UbiE